MNFQIQRVKPEQAPALSKIAFSAKAYWGYPERWMEIERQVRSVDRDVVRE